jgi:hypothetical protein
MPQTQQLPNAWHAGVGSHTFYAKTKEDLLSKIDLMFKSDPDWIEPLYRASVPVIHIKCETSITETPWVGSKSLDVIRVEGNDDGSWTAVTDYWPQ